jgi:hypothetical protein
MVLEYFERNDFMIAIMVYTWDKIKHIAEFLSSPAMLLYVVMFVADF